MSIWSALGCGIKSIGSTLGTGLTSAIGNIPSMLIGGVANTISNNNNIKKQLNASKQLIDYQNDATKSMSTWSNLNGYNLARQGLMAAGLNPNSLQGSSYDTLSSSSSSGISSNLDINASALSQLNASNMAAQNRLLNAQAKSQELQNALTQDKIDAYRDKDKTVSGFVDDDGNKHYETDADYQQQIDEWSDKRKDKSSSLDFFTERVEKPHLSLEAYNAKNSVEMARNELRISNSRVVVEDAGASKARLDSKISKLQINDPEITRALSRMSLSQYKLTLQQLYNLRKDGQLKDLDVAYNRIVESPEAANTILQDLKFSLQQKKDSNVRSILREIQSDGLSWQNALILAISMASALSGAAPSLAGAYSKLR